MAKAFGTSAEDEIKTGSSLLGKALNGNVGVLFTAKPLEDVQAYFEKFSRLDFARTGSASTDFVQIPAGDIRKGEEAFPHTMESQIRALGVPTTLRNGVVSLANDFTICKEGDVLTSEQARLLKMFDIRMAEFKIKIQGIYTETDGYKAQ